MMKQIRNLSFLYADGGFCILSKDLEAVVNTLGKRGLKREVEVGSAIHNSVTMLIDSLEKRGATTQL